MTTYKSIFKGRLEFGSIKSYDKVLKMFHHRVENYYKSDILLNEEEKFDESTTCLNVPRFITQGSEKSWKNTYSLLEYIAQFAVAGEFGAWMTNEGKILHHGIVEPKSDRAAVQAYLRGRELVKEEGKEDEAMFALNQAIAKYERHANAYERRGHINYRLRNYEDALYDFNKSIDLAAGNTEAYLGRANTKMILKDTEGAISDFDLAIKSSIPLQPTYWLARRLKGNAHLLLDDKQSAMAEMRLFSLRKFKKDNPNFEWSRSVLFKYGTLLFETESFLEAYEAFNRAISMEEGRDVKEAQLYLYRGKSAQKAKKKAFKKDWQKAMELGSKEAKKLLKL